MNSIVDNVYINDLKRGNYLKLKKFKMSDFNDNSNDLTLYSYLYLYILKNKLFRLII